MFISRRSHNICYYSHETHWTEFPWKPLPWQRKLSTKYIRECSSYGLEQVGQILTYLLD